MRRRRDSRDYRRRRTCSRGFGNSEQEEDRRDNDAERLRPGPIGVTTWPSIDDLGLRARAAWFRAVVTGMRPQRPTGRRRWERIGQA